MCVCVRACVSGGGGGGEGVRILHSKTGTGTWIVFSLLFLIFVTSFVIYIKQKATMSTICTKNIKPLSKIGRIFITDHQNSGTIDWGSEYEHLSPQDTYCDVLMYHWHMVYVHAICVYVSETYIY